MIVFVLVVEHRHGQNITVHKSEAGARAELVRYVHAWWDEVSDRSGPETPPDDDQEAIDVYFEHASEYYTLESTVLDEV